MLYVIFFCIFQETLKNNEQTNSSETSPLIANWTSWQVIVKLVPDCQWNSMTMLWKTCDVRILFIIEILNSGIIAIHSYLKFKVLEIVIPIVCSRTESIDDIISVICKNDFEVYWYSILQYRYCFILWYSSILFMTSACVELSDIW